MIDFKKASFLLSAPKGAPLPPIGKAEIALFGRSNAGKSSFLNLLFGRKLAFSAKRPGKTEALNYYLLPDRTYLVDTPGYGYQGGGGRKDEEFSLLMEPYLRSGRISGAILVLDVRRLLTPEDEDMLALLGESGIPIALAFRKAEKARQEEKARARALASSLGLPFALTGLSQGAGEGRALVARLLSSPSK